VCAHLCKAYDSHMHFKNTYKYTYFRGKYQFNRIGFFFLKKKKNRT
jgi:hypothetical protein